MHQLDLVWFNLLQGAATQAAFLGHLLGSVTTMHRECAECSKEVSFTQQYIWELHTEDGFGKFFSDIHECLDQFAASETEEVAEDAKADSGVCDTCSR